MLMRASGDPILLLHGNPTWGFLYRSVIPPLVNAGHRVIVPDMIGFGLSEKPAREQAHSLDGHIANLAGLVRQLDLRRLTVVCHDWGGPTGLGFAMSNLERVRALAVMSTWAWPTPPAEFHTRLFPWRTMHAPLVGPYLLGRHNVLARRGVYLSVVDRERFRQEAQAVYEAVLPDREIVVRHAASANHDLAGRRSHAHDLTEQHADIRLQSKQAADRRRDVGGRENSGGRDLIKQRLEQVIVAAVDERHSACRARQVREPQRYPPKPPPTTTTCGSNSSLGASRRAARRNASSTSLSSERVPDPEG